MTHRCLLHLKPWRVLSPLPPPYAGVIWRRLPGRSRMDGGWEGRARTHRSHPRCQGWLGGCTGTSLHPTEV